MITSFLKSIIFDSSPLHQFSKFNNIPWICWFLSKSLSNFVSPYLQLHNRYCHNGQGCVIPSYLASSYNWRAKPSRNILLKRCTKLKWFVVSNTLTASWKIIKMYTIYIEIDEFILLELFPNLLSHLVALKICSSFIIWFSRFIYLASKYCFLF